MRPDFSLENTVNGLVCGVDEVGRGPLAGPVVAAAVILPKGLDLPGLNDSKKLIPVRRDTLANIIKDKAIYSIAEASIAEIEELNILHAALLAMRRAVDALPSRPDMALIDGNKIPQDLSCPAQSVIKGDQISASIAAASIIAKVHRDQMMNNLARTYPGYGWERNMGYGTKEHREAILKLGLTPHHRPSFTIKLRQVA